MEQRRILLYTAHQKSLYRIRKGFMQSMCNILTVIPVIIFGFAKIK